MHAEFGGRIVLRFVVFHLGPDAVQQSLLIPPHRNHVVGFFLDDLLYRFLPTVHRVCCDHLTFQVENWQQFLHGRDLVGLIIHTDAVQAEADMLRPRIDDMQRLLAGGMIMRFSQRLAINADCFSTQRKLKVLNPLAQACLKFSRVRTAEDSTKCVVRRNAVGNLKKLLEPFLMKQREPFSIGPGVRSADCAAQRQCRHVDQQMILPAVLLRVRQRFKECQKFKVSFGLHD